MYFSTSLASREDLPSYLIGSCDIVSSYRDLGIIVKGNLSWSSSCEKICKSACYKLQIIYHSISLPCPMLSKKLYLIIIRSRFAYCPQVWRLRLEKDIMKIAQVQSRATMFILGGYLNGYKDRLETLPLSYWL